MKTLFVSRNIIVLIFAVMLLIYGGQGISYGQGGTPTVTPGETNTSLRVSFIDFLYAFDENAYQIQLRRKSPQGEWITKCSIISLLIGPDKIHSARAGNYVSSAIFTDLEPGVTYEARYRDTNLSECHDNPPSPEPWSAITEGTTHLVTPPRVEFADANLATAVREALDLDTGDGVGLLKIPKVQLVKLTELYVRGGTVRDLSGLEHATELRRLDLWGNRIIDITPLAQLTHLRELDLGGPRTGNEIVDITPLANLTELRELGLSGNQISDISPLAGLTELRELSLSFNRISDISPLTQLIELTMLTLHGNQISDITALTQLTKLMLLGLTTNQISDISPLAQLKKLTLLQLEYNQVRDIIPLAQAESLTKLYLDHNQIRDLSPLTTLTRLTTLDLASNQISDVTPLAQLSESLEELDLRDNRIRDVTPLANLIYLEELKLRDNPITDTSPLSSLLDENPDLDVDIEVIREKGGPTLTVSSSPSLTGMTLHGGIVTLKLSSGAFDLRTKIRDAVTISGITGITFDWTDIEKVSDTEIRIILTYDGTIDKDTMLTFTMGPVGIKNYNRPALTAEILVSADVGGIPTLNASTEAPLTEATLHGSVITLILSGNRYDTNWNYVSQNVTLSGIAGVTFKRHNVERVSDTRVTIPLEFNGNINTESALIFTVGAKAIENYDGPAFTAELPVSIGAGTVSTEASTTDAESGEHRTAFESSTPVGYTGVILSDEGQVYGVPPKYTSDSDPGTVAYMLLAKLKECDFATAEAARRSKVYIKTQALGNLSNFASETVCGVTSRKWTSSWNGVRITHLRFFDESSPSNINEAIYNASTDQYELTSPTSTDENEVPSTTPEPPPEPPADTDAVVSISPASVPSPNVGEQLEFMLNIIGGEAVAGYQATVQFDTTVLRYVESSNGDYLPNGAFFVPPIMEGNLVKLNATSLAGETGGDGTLATLTFEVITPKASTLTLSDVLLINSAGEIIAPTFDADVNGDGSVNIQDLVLIASNIGQTGQNPADANGDGQVNIQDLVLVAGALGTSAAAPSIHLQSLEMFTAADVKSWLSQAQHFNLTDAMAQRGIIFLEQLLAALTPKETALLHNYPNPFNPETWIPYHLSKDAEVTLTIYAVDGQVVRRLALGHQPAGIYQNRSRAAYWDGRNAFGEPVASGIYFYTITAGDFTATRKMLIRK